MKFCQKCGTQNTDEATVCTNCGNAFVAQTQPGQTNTQVVQVNNIVPKKKRGCLIAFIIIAIIAVFIGIGSSGGEEPEKEIGDIGSYNVVVKDHFITENYDDKKVIVVTYTFTNNSDVDSSYDVAIFDKCFQNGIELEKEFFSMDIDNYNTDNKSKTIKPGVSLDVQQAYILNDEETTIDVEIEEFLGFSDPISFTIELE